jgi:hypothetical protein
MAKWRGAMESLGYFKFSQVTALYERGDSGGLMSIAQAADEAAAERYDAQRALQLLARLGDRTAIACCDALSGLRDSGRDCA